MPGRTARPSLPGGSPAGRPLRWMVTQAPGGAGQNPAYRPTHHRTQVDRQDHVRGGERWLACGGDDQRLVHHARPAAGRRAVVRRAPAGADAEPRPPGRRRRAVRPALRPGCAVRTGPGGAVHGHVPDEQPGRGQRHAARPPLRQRRLGRPPGRLRAHAVRLHRPGRRPPPDHRPDRSPPVHVGGRAARLRRRAAADRRPGGVAGPPRRARLRGARLAGDAGHRARPTGRALGVGLPHRPLPRVARSPGRPVVRPRLLLAAPPALRRRRGVRPPLRPRSV